MLSTLLDRYEEVTQRVSDAAKHAGTDASKLVVVAVSKNAEPDDIRALIDHGHRDFGENRAIQLSQRAAMIDEWLERRREHGPSLTEGAGASMGAAEEDPVRWHMVGHLQRNKARKVVDLVRLIHSVDSLRLAEELQALAERKDRTVDILLQVNASGEEQKYGCALPAAIHLAEQIGTMIQLRLRGVMTMAAVTDDPESTRPTFARARETFYDIRSSGVAGDHFDILSMGMSGDYEVAIEEGANLVRVGSSIFGAGEDDSEAGDG